MICPNCESNTEFREGVKKATGKKWAGDFCTDKGCTFVNWHNVENSVVQPPTPPEATGNYSETASKATGDYTDALRSIYSEVAAVNVNLKKLVEIMGDGKSE